MSFQVEFYNRVDPKAWDEQAAALGGCFYHCHAAAIYSARLLGSKALFIKAVQDTGKCVGLAAAAVASPRTWPFSRFCRQATFAATPVAGGDEQMESDFLQAIEKDLRAQGVCRMEFSSYHSPNSDRLLPQGGYVLTGRHEYEVDLTRDLDELFGALPSYRRNEVRRAEKRGVTVREVSTPQGADTVRRFHDVSMERRGASSRTLADSILAARHELVESGRVRILVSYLQGEAVGAESFGVFNGMAYGLEAGSCELGKRNFSPVHLNWAATRIFHQEGLSRLGLGGAKEHEESLREFKRRFGAIETPQPTGYKIISRFGGRLDAFRQKLREIRTTHRAKEPGPTPPPSGSHGPDAVPRDAASREPVKK